jgi:SAM-dependent MidA family methyltransferase
MRPMVRPPPALPLPAEFERAHSERLQALIAADIAAAGGWLPFDAYMRRVLYAPGLGYYTAGATKLGDAASGGDFVTAPEISPLFAAALAAQVAQLFGGLPARIVEFGAGSGKLAADLLRALQARGAPCERYAIVEVSADLRQRQQALLDDAPVEWLDAPPVGFEGVMLANEVLDVLPVKLFARRADGIVERGVVVRDGRLGLAERAAGAELAAAVREIEADVGELPDGYTSEIGFEARAWMRSAADWLARGALLAIDYGFPRREYYHPQRLMGTIMCHFRHHAHADPFWWPGLNDLTAHVDFSAMAQAAHEAGLQVLGYTSQAHFLLNCGLLDQLAVAHSPAGSAAAQKLLSEAEMGELFKVLAVGRGIAGPLLGFARGDRTLRL